MTFLFFIPLCVLAQEKDITGLWKGTLFNDSTQKYYKYEIGISKEKGKYTGFSHTWFLIGDTQYFGVKKVTVKLAGDGKILVEDNGLIANNYPIPPNKGVKQLNVLTLNASDSIMTLAGPFATNRTKDFHSLTGSISLQRKNDFWQSSLVPHLQELGKDEELSFVKEEKQSLAKADAADRELQLAEKNISINKEKAQNDKDKQALAKAKLAAIEKQQQEKLVTKQEAAKKIEAEKDLAKQETATEQEPKKVAGEKEQSEKILTRQEMAKQTAAEKELAKQTAIKGKQEKEATFEKEKQDKTLAKQEAAKTLAAEKLLQQAERAKKEIAKKETAEKINKPATGFKINTEPAADVALRKTIVQQTVNFSADSLQLSLYDNGEIDGDTVSVLMNGQLILAKQGLGIKAIKHTIYIPREMDRIEMVMYAETLGSIAPNTGLLVIKDGKDLYEIRFSGDLQKNASIVFNRRKE
ncbi:MAG: hypothetical protein H7Y86_15965 [Rhizobacter sp.]|nr:hypothetical protein [Ferruginibacter sp.]